MIKIVENGIPIYQQIYDQFIRLIILEVLQEGDKLPSVRELALQININPNTIQKAYKALEQDGFIEALKGKGNFVKSKSEVMKIYRNRLDQNLRQVIDEMIFIGETKSSITEKISLLMEVK